VVRIDNIRSSSAFNPRRRPALAPAAVARFEQAANRVKLSAASTAALALRTRDRCSDSGMRRTAPCRAGRPAGVKAPAAPRWGSPRWQELAGPHGTMLPMPLQCQWLPWAHCSESLAQCPPGAPWQPPPPSPTEGAWSCRHYEQMCSLGWMIAWIAQKSERRQRAIPRARARGRHTRKLETH
jgi:hypothetical protein